MSRLTSPTTATAPTVEARQATVEARLAAVEGRLAAAVETLNLPDSLRALSKLHEEQVAQFEFLARAMSRVRAMLGDIEDDTREPEPDLAAAAIPKPGDVLSALNPGKGGGDIMSVLKGLGLDLNELKAAG